MRKLVLSTLVVVALGVAGFFGFRWWQNRPMPVAIVFHYEAGFRPPPPARLFFDGRLMAEFDSTTQFRKNGLLPMELFASSWEASREAEVSLRPKQLTNAALHPGITGEILTPCGWKAVKASETWPTAEKLAASRKTKSRPGVDVRISAGAIEDKNIEIFVDNRGGPEAKLTLGQSSATVAAGETGKFEFFAPGCEESTALKLNDQTLGKIPRELAARKDSQYGTIIDYDEITGYDPNPPSWTFLVDTSGKRCYELTEKEYAKKGSGWFSPGSKVLTYQGKKLHRLHAVEIHYFLERAPDTIQVTQFGNYESTMATRGQLIESCGW